MSNTREYIGARYVPIFGRMDEESIAWDNSAPYEPLTIVLYQGNSYTSRQYVPAGIDITNTEYWALTGNYNAQVEQYRSEVQTFNGRIAANESAIETVDNMIAVLQSKTKYFTPEEYGAVGDGVADDTQAFIDMIAAMSNGDICILQTNSEYRVTDTLNIALRYCRFYSFGSSETAPTIVWDLGEDPANYQNFHCVELTGDGNSFANIIFSTKMKAADYPGSSGEGNWIFAINTQALEEKKRYDIDYEIYNCGLYFAWGGISVEGRNVWIHNCLFSTIITNSVKIRNFTVEDPDGMRGYRIEDNRFHVAGWGIDTQEVTSYPETFNLVIKGNFFDFCRIIYTGISDNVEISNNTVFQTAIKEGYLIRLWNTLRVGTSTHIVGNFINTFGAPTSGTQGAIHGFIQAFAAVKGSLNIASNSFFTHYTGDGNKPVIVISATTAKLLVNIIGNVIHTEDDSTPIQITTDATNVYGLISGNCITTLNSAIFISSPANVTVGDNFTANLVFN